MAREQKVLPKDFRTKTADLMTFLQLDPAVDLTPRNKDFLDYIERKLQIHITVYNRQQKIIYAGDKFKYIEVNLCWASRIWRWIGRPDLFFGIFSCNYCPQIFDQQHGLTRHLKICEFYKEYQRTGGNIPVDFFPQKDTVLTGVWRSSHKDLVQDLNRICLITKVTIRDVCHDHMSCFDCESSLMRRGDIFKGFPDDTRNTTYVRNHQLYCVGMVSSVPSFEQVKVFLRSSHDSGVFVEEFVTYLLQTADKSYAVMKAKLRPVFNQLNKMYKWKRQAGEKQWVARIRKMYKRLDTHCKQHVVGGYNIFRYDITLLKRCGFLDILQRMDGPVKVMKRRKGTYLLIVSSRLRFFDQINYTGKTSLRQLLREYGLSSEGQKSVFPYNKVTVLDDLNQGLPVYEDFQDVMYGCNALDYERIVYENKVESGLPAETVLKEMGYKKPPMTGKQFYKQVLKTWQDNNCKTLLDVALFYLKLDLKPLLEYMRQQHELFLEEGYDLYSNFLSMSHFSYNYAHSFIDPMAHFFVHIPLEQRQKLQRDLTGGISLLFRRLAEPGMQIRPTERSDGEPITKIKGVDASNLYGWAFAYPQYFGLFVLRKDEDDFKPLFMGERFSESIEWLYYCSKVVYQQDIRTQFSPGGEQYIHVPVNKDGEVDDSSDDDDDDDDDDYDSDVDLSDDEDDQAEDVDKKKKKFKSFRPDGYLVHQNKETRAFEYLGEYYHGYCFEHATPENDEEILVGGKTSKQLREATWKRIELLRTQVDYVEVMYDCKWKKLRRENPEISAFVHSFSVGPKIKKKKLSQTEVLDQILNSDICGFAEVDMVTPMELRNPSGLADFPPIIKNAMVSRDNIDGYGLTYAEKHDLLTEPTRMLIASYFCNRTYFSTDYIRFLDSLGVRITHVYEVMQYQQDNMFKDFVMKTTAERVEADLKGLKHQAKLKKDEINSSYGSTLMNASKMINCRLATDTQLNRALGNYTFVDAEAIGYEEPSSLWELHSRKRRILHKNLITIGFQILQASKIRLLDYYYNHLKKHIPDQCFEALLTDTDSMYICHARESLRACVPDHLLDQYDESCKIWNADETDPHDKRCPGKFHEEFEGTHLVALGVKLYHCMNLETGAQKKAHRGVTPKHLSNVSLLNYESYKKRLFSQEEELPDIIMTGFVDKLGQISTFELRRKGMHAGYHKRRILFNLFSTEPFENM